MKKLIVLLFILLLLPIFSAERYYCEVLDEDLVRQNITEQGENFKIEFRDIDDNLIGYCNEILNGRGNITFLSGEATDIHYAMAYNAKELPNKRKLFCDISGNMIRIKWSKLANPEGESNMVVRFFKNFFGKTLYTLILGEQEEMSQMGVFEKIWYFIGKYPLECIYSFFLSGMMFSLFGLLAAYLVAMKGASPMRVLATMFGSGMFLSISYHSGLFLGSIIIPQYCYFIAIIFFGLGFLCLITIGRKMKHEQRQSQEQNIKQYLLGGDGTSTEDVRRVVEDVVSKLKGGK